MRNILILEDHEQTMQRLKSLLIQAFNDVNISCAYSIVQAANMCQSEEYSLCLLDINLPDGNGIDFLSSIKPKLPTTYFVITTMFDDDEYIFKALRQGANGYILKEQSDNAIVKLLQGIVEGSPPLAPGISRKILKYFNPTPEKTSKTDLSKQETQVLTLIAKGYTRKEVSRLMGISINTVSAYIKSIYKKLSVRNCSEATLEAVRLGLVAVA